MKLQHVQFKATLPTYAKLVFDAQERGITVSEMVRRITDSYYEGKAAPSGVEKAST